MHVIVIGAGVIGASVAYHLATLGVSVTLMEANRPAGGTSGATFAWTNANGKAPPAYFDLNVAGMREHAELSRQLGGSWLHQDGLVEWAHPAGSSALSSRLSALASAGYGARELDRAELAGLEPELECPQSVRPIAFFPDEGWVDTAGFVTMLLGAARALGVRVVIGSEVTALESDGARIAVVTRTARQTGDIAVSCVGPDGAVVAGLAGVALPMRASLGLLAVTAPAAARLDRIVRAPGIDIRPDGTGRFMLAAGGSDQLPADAAADEPALRERADRLATAAAGILPSLRGVPVETIRVGRRAIPEDGFPAVGPLGMDGRLYHVITHSGVTLAPVLGRLVAREIVTGEADPVLEPYRPARFTDAPRA
jgi:glycine/D-amino acid oxidase-like deaminating enzyme